MMKKITLFLLALTGLSLSAQTQFIFDYGTYDEIDANNTGATYDITYDVLNTNPNYPGSQWVIVDYNQMIVSDDGGATFQTLPTGGDYTIRIDSVFFFYGYSPTGDTVNDVTFSIYNYNDLNRTQGLLNENNPLGTATPLYTESLDSSDLTPSPNWQNITLYPNITLAAGENFSIYMQNVSDTLDEFGLMMGFKSLCGAGQLANQSAVPFNTAAYVRLNAGLDGVLNYYSLTAPGLDPNCDNWFTQNAVIIPFVTITPNSMSVEAVSDQLDDLSRTCPSATTTLSASVFGGSGNYTYSWSPATGLSSTTGEQVIATVGSSNQTYTLTVTDVDNGIDSTSQVTVLSLGANVVASGPEVVNLTCGQTTNINATATTQGGGGGVVIDTIFWSGNNANPLVTDVAGTYYATAINSLGCVAYDTVTVEVQGTNNVDYTIPGLLCSGEVINISNNSDRTSGWNFTWYITQSGDTVSSPGGENFIFQFTDPGSYQLTLVGDSSTCVFSKTRSITINDGTTPPCFTSISDLDFNNLAVYPNPSNAKLNVVFDLDKAQDVEITAYTVTGKQVSAQVFDATSSVNTVINTSNLVEGVYILKIKTEQGVKTQRFVVEHN